MYTERVNEKCRHRSKTPSIAEFISIFVACFARGWTRREWCVIPHWYHFCHWLKTHHAPCDFFLVHIWWCPFPQTIWVIIIALDTIICFFFYFSMNLIKHKPSRNAMKDIIFHLTTREMSDFSVKGSCMFQNKSNKYIDKKFNSCSTCQVHNGYIFGNPQ